jgi:hypothetical protein
MKGFRPTTMSLTCAIAFAFASNLAANQSAFAQSASPAKRCGEQKTHFDSIDAVAHAVACATASRRLLVIGDLHGTNEIPDLLSKLVAAASTQRPVRLGLEIETFEQAPISAYVASKGTEADKAALLHDGWWTETDGRASGAIVRLIESMQVLRAAGRDVEVFTTSPVYPGDAAIKAAGGGESFKEKSMADAIQLALDHGAPDQLVITLMGNYHAGNLRPANENGQSVVERLAKSSPYFVLPIAKRGESSDCIQSGCGVHAFNDPRASGITGISLSPPADLGHGITQVKLTLPTMTASPPAKSKAQPVGS